MSDDLKNNPNKRILYIDDEPGFAKSIISLLTSKNIISAGDLASLGKVGLKKLKQQHYDLLITDIMLPDIDGRDLICDLRADGLTLPIVVITADSEARYAEFYKCGADHVFGKPFKFSELYETVSLLLA